MSGLVTGATPLAALQAVSMDTETTGLDPTSARIVQLGTVTIAAGNVDTGTGWEKIVDPGIAIPPRSAEIHGITSAMTREAPRLSKVWDQFNALLEKRIIIGHSIGFDLAILDAEAKRNDLKWQRPRSLCVRMLSTLIAPSLADHSLDALAEWLGVKISNRHQALGDALAAGEVFCALIPRLSDAGINTLAEAERASRRLAPEVERHQSAGWQLPVDPAAASRQKVLMGGSESFAYRLSVAEVMAAPPIVLKSDQTLKDAMHVMKKKAISSVFVSDSGKTGGNARQYGIFTERDAMRLVCTHGADSFTFPLADVVSKPISTVRASAFIYRAMGRMTRLKFRHLGVRDEEGNLVGCVSARDLLKARAGPAIVLDDTIETAQDARQLAAAWASLPTVTGSLLDEDIDAHIICRIVSEEIRAMTRRAAQLAVAEMKKAGNGEPPCAYAIMVLGSGGRGESMLVPDQDNAVVYAEGEPESAADEWFAEMGSIMADILDQSGIPYCNGGVMAKNPQWRGSLATWKARVDEWVRRSKPQDLLNVDIFFDQMPVEGDTALGHELFRYAYEQGHENVQFAKLLGETLASVPDPFGFFGRLSPENNKLDLKRHILFPVSALARTLAIRHNVAKHSTSDRVDGLVARSIGGSGDLPALIEAHRLALGLVLNNQGRDIESGIKPSNFIDLAALSREESDKLRAALRHMQSIPTLVRDLMFV